MSATTGKDARIDGLLREAREGLERNLFQAEREALKALEQARSISDFGRMIAAVEPLWSARRRRMDLAMEAGRVVVVHETAEDPAVLETGCYVIEPPQVGADARRMRLAAMELEIPMLVVCREPINRLKLCPVVAISPGTTLRTRIDPPADLDAPDLEWFAGALEQLGNNALAEMDPDLESTRRVDQLMDRLTALPEHAGLHEALIEACRTASGALSQ